MGIAAIIVVGGFGLALLSNVNLNRQASFGPASPYNGEAVNAGNTVNSLGSSVHNLFNFGSVPEDSTQVIGQVNTVTMTATQSSATTYPTGGLVPAASGNVTQGTPSGAGGMIEFSSSLALRGASPQQLASSVVDLAYTYGGYVAYQSTYTSSANVVIRVPAAEYQVVLSKIEDLGTVVSLTSSSNDVRVQYTDLNATLASLTTEQGALLRLLNQSVAINTTLAIEAQLQQVNQQINDVQSQILQMKTLISYATINVTISQTAQQSLPTMTLSASPKTGLAPLSVTFNANVKGGAQPYVFNYNFGDGYASQGQIVIHTFYQPGNYNVTVGVTDQEGNTTGAWTVVRVTAPPAQSGLNAFFDNVGGLFLSVVEGIVEVAVVVLPIAAVGAAVIIPLQRRGRGQKDIKQSQ